MTFHVGQKVVCIKRDLRWTNNRAGPKFGDVLTIRGFDSHPFRGLLFEERFEENFYADGTERGFGQIRFRPIVERKTDISIFTAMLNPSKQGVDA